MLLIVAPIVLSAVAPAVVEGKVGVFERVTLSAGAGDSRAIGGFIAPEGWTRIEAEPVENKSDSTEASVQSFISPDERATISVELHSDISDPEQLLTQNAPVGAAFVPTSTPAAVNNFTLALRNFDLEAGTGGTQMIAACASLIKTNCLLITSTVSASVADPLLESDLQGGYLVPEISPIIESAEVFG